MRIKQDIISISDNYSKTVNLKKGTLYSFIGMQQTANDQITATIHNGKLIDWDSEFNTITLLYEQGKKKPTKVKCSLDDVTVICEIKAPLDSIRKVKDVNLISCFFHILYTPLIGSNEAMLVQPSWLEVCEKWRPLAFQTIKIKDGEWVEC